VLEWTIIGSGDVVERHVGPALSAHDCRIASLWSPTRSNAAVMAKRLGTKLAQDATDAILSADAVYVCSPVSSHVEYALAAIRASKHVIVEKPLAAGISAIDHLADAITRDSRTQFMVAYYRRYMPWLLRVEQLLASNMLGSLSHVEIDFSAPFDTATKSWRIDPAISGGGVVADAGCHRLDYLVAILGWPESWTINSVTFAHPAVESDVEMALTWLSGVTANCRFSWNRSARDTVSFGCMRGQIKWSSSDSASLVIQSAATKYTETVAQPAHVLSPMIAAFRRRILDGARSRPDVEHAVRFDNWLSEILRSVHGYAAPSRASFGR
jgi:1,5-anhydro-D-fructose reductase (1,5-anhydro-D-mannitol-forming)